MPKTRSFYTFLENFLATPSENYKKPSSCRISFSHIKMEQFPCRVWWELFGHPCREISFGGARRYQAFKTLDDFEAFMTKSPPEELHIGAIYDAPPNITRLHNLHPKPVRRELVIDIDVDGYTSRSCGCGNAQFCRDCWLGYMNPTILAIDAFLRTELGLKKTIWAFSGRRGVHAFLLDTLDYDDELQDWIVKQVMKLRIPVGDTTIPICIDSAVSLQKSHLLRSPFSKHPATGLINRTFVPRRDYYPLDWSQE